MYILYLYIYRKKIYIYYYYFLLLLLFQYLIFCVYLIFYYCFIEVRIFFTLQCYILKKNIIIYIIIFDSILLLISFSAVWLNVLSVGRTLASECPALSSLGIWKDWTAALIFLKNSLRYFIFHKYSDLKLYSETVLLALLLIVNCPQTRSACQ